MHSACTKQRSACTLIAAVLAASLPAAFFAGVFSWRDASAALPSTPGDGIPNIGELLKSCPQNDPNYAMFRADFELRREGAVVGAVPCTAPVSAMPVSQFSDELVVLQALRVIYYMEGGRGVPYPWTSGSMYDWMKAKIGGIEIAFGSSHCCATYGGELFIVLASQSDFNRDPDRRWAGLSERIALIAHETRHVDGYPHTGGCPLFPNQPFGCDQRYDESNLSPYGFQWWLNAKWLSGELNVGYSCLSSSEVSQIATAHLNAANNDYGKRFVENAPPLLTMPAQPGGPCGSAGVTGSPPPTPTPVRTASPTPGASPTQRPTPTPSLTAPPQPTLSPTPTPLSPGATDTPPPTPAPTLTPTPTATPSPAETPPPETPSPPPSLRPTPTPTPGAESPAPPTPLRSPTPTRTSQTPAPPTEAATPTPPPATTPGARPIAGDLDCDGDADAADALRIQRLVAGLPPPLTVCLPPAEDAADVDCDGEVDSVDALKVLRHAAALPVFQVQPCPGIGT